MDTTGLLYPFDPTGKSPQNLVENERQTINSPGIENFYFIMPKAGPFYANEEFELVLFPGEIPLTEGIDYAFGHEFRSATKSTGIPVYGSIVFYNHATTGSVRLKYQNVGGTWTLSEEKIAEILTNLTIDPRITTWEQVVDMPIQFPPTAHEYDIADMVGMSAVRDKIGEVAAAVLASSGQALQQHMQDKENPHQVNKEQVGLGLVLNMGLATEDAAGIGTSNIGYMTPRLTQVAISRLIAPIVQAHVDRTDNPHGVTALQVGLGNVGNFPLADRPVAESGVSNTHYLTPLSGRWLFGALNNVFTGHLADQANPHRVTADQVGAYSTTQMDSILSLYLRQDGTAANANRVYGMTMSELLENVSQVPMSNALQFNGLTLSEVSALILQGTAADSIRFAGQTRAEFDAELVTLIGSKVDGATIPPVNSVKRLVGDVPDPMPDGYQPTYDIIELDRSYTKIARVPVQLLSGEDAQDVCFQIHGGRSYVSTARPGVSMVTISFDRILDANNKMTVENIGVMNVNGGANHRMFYQIVDEIQVIEVDGEAIENEVSFLDVWLEDEKLRGPITCLDLSGGNVQFLENPFPEFEIDTQLVQPNGTIEITQYKATDVVQAALNAAVTRVSALETRAGNNESALQALSTNTTTVTNQLAGRLLIVEGTFEDTLGLIQDMTSHFNAL